MLRSVVAHVGAATPWRTQKGRYRVVVIDESIGSTAGSDSSSGVTGDWRLQGQERYLMSANLRWRPWVQQRHDWDHDHCEFCAAKFCDRAVDEEALRFGWTTDDDRWICDECARDFKERFAWSFDDTG